MTNGEKFIEIFGNIPNFRLKTTETKSGSQFEFIAFLQEWWYENYKENKND